MFGCSAIRLGRRQWFGLLLGTLLLLVWFCALPARVEAQGPEEEVPAIKKEYVPILPDVRAGAPPQVRALPLKFDAARGAGEIPLEIVPVGFWKSELPLRDLRGGEKKYDVFEFELEAPSHLIEVGEPNVPIRVVEVDIPPGAELDRVVLRPELLKTVEDVVLAPNQEPLPIQRGLIRSREQLTQSKEVYAQEAAYPGKFHEVTTVSYLGGRKVVILKTFPVQYHPASKQVKFYKLTGALTFKAKEIPRRAPGAKVLRPREAPELPAPLVPEANQWEVYQRQIGSDLMEEFEAMDLPSELRDRAARGIPCVIICADLFYCPAKELADHRTRKGTLTAVVRVRPIERGISGKDSPDKIRNFIRILRRYYATQWVLLFGDVVSDGTSPFVQVPTRMVVDPAPYAGVDDGWIPCDYYYACLDGTWDANGNGRYGELADKPDLLPEVCVGRLPTNDFEDAAAIVHAIIGYENSPPKPKGALLAANDLGWGCHEIVFKERTILPLVKKCGWSPTTRLYQKWGNLTLSTFAKVANNGVDFIEYYGHGSPGSTQLMTMAQVESTLKATPSYPAVFALSCSTSRYDGRECFGEAWVEGNKASSYVGSTRVAYGGSSSGEGLDVRFIQKYCGLGRTGCALDYAKYQLFKDYGWNTYTHKTILEFSLFGDPVMKHVK